MARHSLRHHQRSHSPRLPVPRHNWRQRRVPHHMRARGCQSWAADCAPRRPPAPAGAPSSANDCCGSQGGYCGNEWSSSNPNQWISVGSCTGLDFIRVSPGCGVEVATAANGGGARYTYDSSPFVCGRTCESRPTPGCDSVRSIRLFATGSTPVAALPPPPPGPVPSYVAVSGRGCSSYIHMDDFSRYGVQGTATTLEQCAAAVQRLNGREGCIANYFFYETHSGSCNCQGRGV